MHRIIFKHKKYLIFIIAIISLSFLLGFMYYYLLDSELKIKIINTLKDYNYYQNNGIIKDLIIMSTILISSFFIIGMPLSIMYIMYEFFTFGFLLNLFLYAYKIKGILYFLKYAVFNRLMPLILIVIFTYKIINISRYVIGLIIYKDSNIKNKIIINFKNNIYIILFVFISNIIILFLTQFIKI